MSEREIRKLLRSACAELDRYAEAARKAALPVALGAGIALTGCPGTSKQETGPDPVKTDRVQEVADAGAALIIEPDSDGASVTDAGLAKEPPPPPPPPPDWEPDRPYMAPDAAPLCSTLGEPRVA